MFGRKKKISERANIFEPEFHFSDPQAVLHPLDIDRLTTTALIFISNRDISEVFVGNQEVVVCAIFEMKNLQKNAKSMPSGTKKLSTATSMQPQSIGIATLFLTGDKRSVRLLSSTYRLRLPKRCGTNVDKELRNNRTQLRKLRRSRKRSITRLFEINSRISQLEKSIAERHRHVINLHAEIENLKNTNRELSQH
uniref:Uncharacterized protein n=1 Tax=Glossina palpalis gambiensis TaxID=67801 RepID=A0A1B0BFK1_9MUSC